MSRESGVDAQEPLTEPDWERTSEEQSLTPRTIALLGLGLIGGSFGLALRQFARDVSGPFPPIRILGWDACPNTILRAKRRGAIHEGTKTADEAVQTADLIVLAVPVSVTIPLLQQITPSLKPNAAVTDVGSTKSRIVAEGETIIGGRFMGGHPMAGSQQSGIGAAKHSLFIGAPWILTPTPQTSNDAYRTARLAIQRARPVFHTCDPIVHDEVIATLSHLPHLLAYGLAQTAADLVEPSYRPLAAGSFASGTRVAKSSPAFWRDILMDNREAVLKSLEAQTQWLQEARSALEDNDADRLQALLDKAHQARHQFPGG